MILISPTMHCMTSHEVLRFGTTAEAASERVTVSDNISKYIDRDSLDIYIDKYIYIYIYLYIYLGYLYLYIYLYYLTLSLSH